MENIFDIQSYHLDLYDLQGKYVGHVPMDKPDRKDWGYSGRRKMHVNNTAYKSGKPFQVYAEFMTECIPICGRVISQSLEEKHAILKKHYLTNLTHKKR